MIPRIRPSPVPWIASSGWSVLALDDIDALADFVPAWDDLASAALEPNSFLESWMLLPALRALGSSLRFRFILIFRPHPTNPRGAPVLCALFPFERQTHFRHIPTQTLSAWSHPYGLLATPLIRSGTARHCFDLLFHWLANDKNGASIIELHQISADGPFYQELATFLNETRRSFLVTDCWTRALFRRRSDAEAYMKHAFSGDHRKSLRRKAKRLSEEGKVDYKLLQREEDLTAWVDDFLRIEASGWKGQQGTAIDSRPSHRAFFHQAARDAFKRGKMGLFALLLNGKPIAYQCYFTAGPGSFAFKTAYDEAYSRFSPGTLIQLELIQRFHQQPTPEWMDSNSEPDGYLNEIWPDRRTMQSLVIPTGKGWGELIVALLPAFQWVKRKLRGGRTKALETPPAL